MSVNAELARIFGSDLDAIYLADVGATLPTDLDGVLDPAFEDVGWLGADGITESPTGTVNKLRGHQGNGVVRTRVTEGGTTVSFNALEDKELTNSLRYFERSSTTTAGVRKSKRSPGQRITKKSAVIDLIDADNDAVKVRFVIPVLEIAPNGDKVANSTDIASFPFVGEIIGDYDVYATDVENAGNP